MTFNSWYLVMGLTALLAWGAQWLVRKVYRKYQAVPNRRGASGLEAAQALLAQAGLHGVRIAPAEGSLRDRYNPETKTLHLSEDVLNGKSVTALGIVAHEVGHAAQHAQDYRIIRLRTKLAGPVGRLAMLSPLVFIGGIWLDIPVLVTLGGLMLASQVVFALVTLPVERDASRRAVAMLAENGWASDDESPGVSRVLRSASLTYATDLGRRLALFLFFAGMFAAAGGGGLM